MGPLRPRSQVLGTACDSDDVRSAAELRLAPKGAGEVPASTSRLSACEQFSHFRTFRSVIETVSICFTDVYCDGEAASRMHFSPGAHSKSAARFRRPFR